jgi:hypothetical protein
MAAPISGRGDANLKVTPGREGDNWMESGGL